MSGSSSRPRGAGSVLGIEHHDSAVENGRDMVTEAAAYDGRLGLHLPCVGLSYIACRLTGMAAWALGKRRDFGKKGVRSAPVDL